MAKKRKRKIPSKGKKHNRTDIWAILAVIVAFVVAFFPFIQDSYVRGRIFVKTQGRVIPPEEFQGFSVENDKTYYMSYKIDATITNTGNDDIKISDFTLKLIKLSISIRINI